MISEKTKENILRIYKIITTAYKQIEKPSCGDFREYSFDSNARIIKIWEFPEGYELTIRYFYDISSDCNTDEVTYMLKTELLGMTDTEIQEHAIKEIKDKIEFYKIIDEKKREEQLEKYKQRTIELYDNFIDKYGWE